MSYILQKGRFIFHPEIDVNTFRKFYFYNTFKRGHHFLKLAGFAVIVFLFALCNFYVKMRYFGIFFVIVAVLIPVLFCYRYLTGMNYQIKSQKLKEQPIKPYDVELSNLGVHIKTSKQDVHFEWDKVADAFDAGDVLYLYYCPTRAVILPYRNLEDGDKSELATFLTENLKSRFIAAKE